MLKICSFFLFALALPLAAQQPKSCLDDLELRLARQTLRQNKDYLAATGQASGIKPDNETRLDRGYNPRMAVLLVHGFMASPFEVRPLAQALNAAGFTVLSPLIDGFGSSAAVANRSTHAQWRKTVETGAAELSRCYERIALIGFSLGGGLVADYAFARAQARDGGSRTAVLEGASRSPLAGEGVKIASLVLLSPYFKTAVPMSRLLNRVADGLSTDGTASFALLRATSKLLGSENPDLQAPIKYPAYYNEAMPLKAVDQVLDLSKILSGLPGDKVLSIPVFLSYSEADQTIDWQAARDFVAHHFEESTLFTFSLGKKVAHQIELKDSGADVQRLNSAIARFVAAH